MGQAVDMAAGFENIEMSADIVAHVSLGIEQRVAHPGLGRQMHRPGDAAELARQRHHVAVVGDVQRLEGEARLRLESRQARTLEGHVVVIAQIIDTDDLIAARQQGVGDVVADEPGHAGDKDGHARIALQLHSPLPIARGGPKIIPPDEISAIASARRGG